MTVPHKGQVLADQLLLCIHMCVSEYIHISGADQIKWSFVHVNNFGRPIAAVSTYTHVLQGSELRVGRPIAAAVNTHMCVAEYLYQEAKRRFWTFNNFGRPKAAVSTHTCVAEEVNSGLHTRVKGWPTNGCCGHTLVCFWIHAYVWRRPSQLKLSSF